MKLLYDSEIEVEIWKELFDGNVEAARSWLFSIRDEELYTELSKVIYEYECI
jgi:hypothetical protein